MSIVYSRPIPMQSDTRRGAAVKKPFLLLCGFTEHYRKLVADYFSLGYYVRYAILHARENKSKRGAYLDGNWEIK
jgi:hypothetical protein